VSHERPGRRIGGTMEDRQVQGKQERMRRHKRRGLPVCITGFCVLRQREVLALVIVRAGRNGAAWRDHEVEDLWFLLEAGQGRTQAAQTVDTSMTDGAYPTCSDAHGNNILS
jgi:hypothetical protein